ncbi:PLDc N-terminal domain-containing protein [Acaricomes phytoseiuli]|uniref:PLDc N-terminal domain-containing protein n=1 Tax=Acaricomes phytoseiuli TaxID=291968 RepID=UPI0022229309|nr:PLDc N-terminal domain-containing protein [Acaricomes phytoseiuli]MCW1250349.1 PLDc N-terminal domain-containing protein [Acaricomes phytoseiuli]
MSDSALDPAVSAGYDILSVVVQLLAILLLISALISLVRFRGLRTVRKLLWGAAIVLLPILGPLGWFLFALINRRQRPGLSS